MSAPFVKLKTRNHSAFRLYYHLVLSTKYRHKCLTGQMLDRLETIFKDLLLKWGGESDHVHLLFEVEPTVKLSSLISRIKRIRDGLPAANYRFT